MVEFKARKGPIHELLLDLDALRAHGLPYASFLSMAIGLRASEGHLRVLLWGATQEVQSACLSQCFATDVPGSAMHRMESSCVIVDGAPDGAPHSA